MNYKAFLFLFLVVTLSYSVSATLGYDNPTLPRVSLDTSSCLCSSVTGNASFNSSYADATFLKLTADNDPLTGDLSISKADPLVTFIDDIYSPTYTSFGFVFGSPTWQYFNGENIDSLYFGGTSLFLEPGSGGGWTLSSSSLLINAFVAGGDQQDFSIIAPQAVGSNNLTGGDIFIDAGKSVGTQNSSVFLRGAMGSGNGNSTITNSVVEFLVASGGSFNTSNVRVRAGGTTGTIASVGGSLSEILTTNANSGTGETQMHSYLIQNSTLGSPGESLSFVAGGSFATSINNKQLRLLWNNATSTLVLYDSGACPITTGQEWSLEADIVRVNSTTMKSISRLSTASAATCVYADYFTGVTNFTRPMYLNLTGTGGASSDLQVDMSKLSWSDS